MSWAIYAMRGPGGVRRLEDIPDGYAPPPLGTADEVVARMGRFSRLTRPFNGLGLPVLAVPIPSKHLGGLDSLLSMVQMPKGVPVATFAIGDGGSANAGLFAVAMLALNDAGLAKRLQAFRIKQADAVKAAKLPELS